MSQAEVEGSEFFLRREIRLTVNFYKFEYAISISRKSFFGKGKRREIVEMSRSKISILSTLCCFTDLVVISMYFSPSF